MGASQSSAKGSSDSVTAIQAKTSYYTLLGVERTADDVEIKKAYRRKALELHPDRNYGDVERTTALFSEVQAAYEVLSDPQERAWYDSHEAQILKGDDDFGDGQAAEGYEHSVKVTAAEDIMKIVRKFHGGVDFSDSPTGFFGFLRDTFAQLAKEEEIAANWQGADDPSYPPFGHKDDDYDNVVKPFYAQWNSFATRKTFAWKDEYKMSDAPDRRYRRAMEKENKRLREEGIREFNEAVRSLVMFVRKRDPRYRPNTQTEAERQKVLREAAQAQAVRQRAANAKKAAEAQIPDWARTREPEEKDEHEGKLGEEEESEEEHFECVACRKTFKSDKQFVAHEKSKKHQRAVQALRKRMEKDEEELDLDGRESGQADTPNVAETDEDVDGTVAGHSEFEDKNASNGIPTTALENLTMESDGDGEDADLVPSDASSDPSEERSEYAGEGGGDDVGEQQQQRQQEEEEDDEGEDDDYAPRSSVKSRLQESASLRTTSPKPGKAAPAATEALSAPAYSSQAPPSSEEEESSSTKPSSRQGKAAQKRAKKAAQQQGAKTHSCSICNAAFPSRTRLFQHVKDFGHAAPKTDATAKEGRGKRRKGKG